MDSENQPNIIDILLQSDSYVIIISGLPMSPIDTIVKELETAFSQYIVVLDFMHLSFDDTSKLITDRINDVTKDKNRMVIVKCQTFIQKGKCTKQCYITHINISINNNMINNESLATSYKNALKNFKINKYFNYKSDIVMETFIDQIFYYIIDMAEKKVYGDTYDEYKTVIENVL